MGDWRRSNFTTDGMIMTETMYLATGLNSKQNA
jgi:hypothetical protein